MKYNNLIVMYASIKYNDLNIIIKERPLKYTITNI